MITLDLSILNQKGTPMFYSDLTANRPAAGIIGRIFIATDSPYGIFRDTGSGWEQIAGSGGGGNTIYTENDTLTSDRTISSGGFTLTFAPQTTFLSSLIAANNVSKYSVLGQNTLSYSAGFSSSNLGLTYGAIGGINLQTFAGSATFAQSNLASANISINSVDFSAAGSTITMTQATGLRVMAGHQSQFQYQGTNSGTITHAAISQNLGFYRPPSATGILTITNAYGHLINDLNDYGSGFTFTNRWGLYQSGANDRNFFNGTISLKESVGISSLNLYGNNYILFDGLTPGQGIAASFMPSGTPSNAAYVFQFSKSSTSVNNNLLITGGGASAPSNSANKHIIATSSDGGATGQQLVLRVAPTATAWSNLNDQFTIFPTGDVVVQNTSATAFDAGFRFDCIGTSRFNGRMRFDGQSAATAGGNAGLHLIVNLDGVNYKIALLNL